MTDQFVGEIRLFPFNFLPAGWMWCDGSLLPIPQNTALFALLGINYGGDGKSTFGLPDLMGRVPMQPGQGNGLSEYALGEKAGAETVTLQEHEIPVHTHLVSASTTAATSRVPSADRVLAQPSPGAVHAVPGGVVRPSDLAVSPAGADHPHNNMQPYLTLYFAIATQGIYPHRP